MSSITPTVEIVGDIALTRSLVDKSVTELYDSVVITISPYALYGCTSLNSAVFENAISVGTESFEKCTSLKKVSLPKVNTLSSRVFYKCSSLEVVDLGAATNIGIANRANLFFEECSALKALIIRTNSVCTVNGTDAVITARAPDYLYVPAALVDSYKSSSIWSQRGADTIRALEDYTVDGTTTGELDETKI